MKPGWVGATALQQEKYQRRLSENHYRKSASQPRRWKSFIGVGNFSCLAIIGPAADCSESRSRHMAVIRLLSRRDEADKFKSGDRVIENKLQIFSSLCRLLSPGRPDETFCTFLRLRSRIRDCALLYIHKGFFLLISDKNGKA